jgi:nucleotide-binding universal stress UspA family protein
MNEGLYRHVACAVDDSEPSLAALEEARRVWGGGPGRLSVVHVAEPPVHLVSGVGALAGVTQEDWVGPARDRLAGVVAGIPGAEAVLLTGDPTAQAVCDWAAEAGVDLLVAAAYRGALNRALVGSFARHVAYHAPCPVLLVGPGAIRARDGEGGGGHRKRVPEAWPGVLRPFGAVAT